MGVFIGRGGGAGGISNASDVGGTWSSGQYLKIEDAAGTLGFGTPSSIAGSITNTDGLSEGSSNLYFTTARATAAARAAVSAASGAIVSYNASTGVFSTDATALNAAIDGRIGSTDDLDEGTANLYYTDARARGAFSASGSILTYSNGVFGISSTGLNAAIDGRIGIKNLSALADVPPPEAGKILQRNAANTGYQLVDLPSGGGGGSYTLPVAGSALGGVKEGGDVDVDASGNMTVKDNAIGADELDVSGDGASGQVLTSDGDGSMSWTDKGSGGGGSFSPSNTSAAITETDRIAVWHGGTPGLNTIDELAIDLQPFHTSRKLFPGYRYRTAALTAKGQVRFYKHNEGQDSEEDRIQVAALDAHERAFNALFTPGAKFSFFVQSSRYELIVLNTVQVASNTINLLEASAAVDAEVGTFSTDQSVSIKTEGKSVQFEDLTQSTGSTDRDAMLAMSRKAITDAIPGQASDQEVQEGSNVPKWVAPDQMAAERRHIEADMSWGGYSWQTTGVDGSTNKRAGEDDNIDLLFQFVDSQANAQAQDVLFHPGDILTIRHDDSNLKRGRVEYADARALGSNWVFEAKLKDDDDFEEIGSLSAGDSVTLSHESELHNQILNNMVATQAEAEAGTASTKLETPQRVTQWFAKKVQIGKFATSDGFTLASSGSDIAQDHFWFQSGSGNNLAGRIRGGSAADTAGLRSNLDGPHDLYFQNGNEWVFARMNGAATEVDGHTGNSGQASNKEFRFTIGEHRASTGAASATGAWSLTIYGDLPAAMEEIVPPFSFTPHVVKPGTHGQVMTSVNGRTEWAAAPSGGGGLTSESVTLPNSGSVSDEVDLTDGFDYLIAFASASTSGNSGYIELKISNAWTSLWVENGSHMTGNIELFKMSSTRVYYRLQSPRSNTYPALFGDYAIPTAIRLRTAGTFVTQPSGRYFIVMTR